MLTSEDPFKPEMGWSNSWIVAAATDRKQKCVLIQTHQDTDKLSSTKGVQQKCGISELLSQNKRIYGDEMVMSQKQVDPKMIAMIKKKDFFLHRVRETKLHQL